MIDSKIRVVELFAGVGGFHLGLHRASSKYEIVWADQYEPARKNQFAFNIYKHNFPITNVVNDDISKVNKRKIPNMDLLVGGFPCQDYSVASSSAKGLYGKKGVLWWDVKEVIEAKWPQFILLENVDRLLTSPGVNSAQPGRDFGMILRTLSDLGYGASWKMINAAEYGFPQRRRRTFIFAFREDTVFREGVADAFNQGDETVEKYLKNMRPFSSSLRNIALDPVEKVDLQQFESLVEFSNQFKLPHAFRKTGIMLKGQVYMADYVAEKRKSTNLDSIIQANAQDESLYLTPEKILKFQGLKSGFHTIKKSRTGHYYKYGMGGIAFPDPLDRPARTMVTSEHTVSRMSHVVEDPGNNKLRLISPNEAELINTFPQGWTKLDGVSDSNRYFTMGNALVVDLVKEIGISISNIFEKENKNDNFTSIKTVEKIIH